MSGSRDPRRLFNQADRLIAYENQDGLCAVCGGRLTDGFHMHHKAAWSRGGPTVTANAAAVCPECHPSAINVEWPELTPRLWQLDALERVLPSLRAGRMATANAAPGAGKTLFTAFVIAELLASQTIRRVVVVVPNDNLRGQWMRALAEAGIYIDPRAWEGVENPDDYVGSVITYQKLRDSVVRVLDRRASNMPTLYVFDEVHHVADNGGWGKAVEQLVGTFDDPRRPVLNLTGTLFRSKGRQYRDGDGRLVIESRERIATVDYRPDPDEPAKLLAQADYAITSAELIASRHLRHVSLFEFDFDHGLQVIDLASETVTSGGIIDLTEQPRRVRSEALKRVLRDELYLRPKLDTLLEKLADQRAILDGHHVKALIACDDQRHAEQVHRLLRELTPDWMAQPFLAINDEARSREQISMFRELRKPAVLVNVRMVTEGFDCPDVTTLAHLSSWSARLFINQMVARAMRITDRERQMDRILPAALLIPQDELIRRAYAEVLVGTMHVLDLPALCTRCGQDPCICEYICPRCGQLPCICDEVPPPPPPERQFDFEVLGEAELVAVGHDGDDVTRTLARLDAHLERAGVPATFRPPVAHAVQKAEEARGAATSQQSSEDTSGPQTRPATPREVADGLNRYLDRAARWSQGYGFMTAREFNTECNRAAGIRSRSKGMTPSVDQLRVAIAKADELIRGFCASSVTPLPSWIGGAQ